MLPPPAPRSPAPARRLRVLLAAEGTRGDVFPLLAVARALQARGHEVALCAPPENAAVARRRGVPFHPVGGDVRAYLRDRAALVARAGWRLTREMQAYVRAAAPLQVRALREHAAGADRVVSAGVQLGAACVARGLGIPHRAVLYCPTLLASAEHPPFVLPVENLPRPVNRLTWRAVLTVYGRFLRSVLDPVCAELGLPAPPDVYRALLSDRPVLAADRLLAPAPADAPVAVEQVPCLHPLAGWDDEPLPAKLEAFLDSGEPPVFLGFGSMTDPDPRTTTRVAIEAAARAGRRALLSRGWAGLGEGALPEGIRVVGTVSHARLFPRCAAVVHHGGAGTTTTAARAGVPQVVVPHLLDQVYFARRVRELGLGPPAVPRRRLDARRLGDALREACENEIVAERARWLGEALRAEAVAGPDPATWVEATP